LPQGAGDNNDPKKERTTKKIERERAATRLGFSSLYFFNQFFMSFFQEPLARCCAYASSDLRKLFKERRGGEGGVGRREEGGF